MAFAGLFLQDLDICDVNASASVTYDAIFLHPFSDFGDGRPPYADHCSQIIMSNGQVVTSQIPHSEKPTRHPSLYRVTRIAGRRLLNICHEKLRMRCEHLADFRTALKMLQRSAIDHRRGTRYLHDNFIDGLLTIKRLCSAYHAVTADHNGLNNRTIDQLDHKREDA